MTAPESARLFVIHVPIAFTAFAAFTWALGQSILYLARPEAARDGRAHAAVEVGLIFSLLTLGTGMLWGKAEWGVYWRFQDVKLVLVLIMTIVYAGSLLLRREISDPDRRGRVVAVYTSAAFVTIPLAWFAHRLWTTYHPVVFAAERSDAGVVTPAYLWGFFLGLVVFIAYFIHFYIWRSRQLVQAEDA